MQTFQELRLPPQLAQTIHQLNFKTPTPIQSLAIPKILDGHDLIGLAQTGTGKTLAFGIPLLSWLIKNPKRIGLILAPTRELAAQIMDVCETLTQRLPYIRPALLIGGVPIGRQEHALRKRPSIIIATPGRLLDHIKHKRIALAKIGVLVLDEADRMLDMGFAPQLEKIRANLPTTRQTLFFSATMPSEVDRLSKQYLNNPTKVSVGTAGGTCVMPPKAIRQSVVEITHEKKGAHLVKEIQRRNGTILIFARTKSRTDRLAKMLAREGFDVGRIHGDRSQSQRTAAIRGFKNGDFRILVATDIAGRGLDIPEIGHVINFDMPQVPEDYIHRIGRTARAGSGGQALSFVTPADRSMWKAIGKLLAPIKTPKACLQPQGA